MVDCAKALPHVKVVPHVQKECVAVSVSSSVGATMQVKPTVNQLLYVKDNRIGITGGNEIVPPASSMDADLLALYLLEKGGN